MRKQWHSEECLDLLLQVANQERGTDFQLGIVEQGAPGSNGTSATKGKRRKTRAYIVGNVKWNCPVLWIFKNYGEEKSQDSVHWEGMGNVLGGKKRKRGEAIVDGWRIYDA